MSGKTAQNASTFRVARPGVVFHETTGKLYLFRPGVIDVLAGWPRMLAWRKTRSHPGWKHFRPRLWLHAGDIPAWIKRLDCESEPNGQLLLPFFRTDQTKQIMRDEIAKLRWQSLIPTEVRNAVEVFRRRHWHLLSMIARAGSAALDLALHNPALCFALASSWIFRKPPVVQHMRAARTLLQQGRKQREIMAWLGFPDTEAARKVLCKLLPSAISVNSLLCLKEALRYPACVTTFSHLPRISHLTLRIAIDPSLLEIISWRIVLELSEMPEHDQPLELPQMARDVHALWKRLYPRKQLPKPTTVERLTSLYEDLALQEQVLKAAQDSADLPEPPFPGTADIQPIRSAQGLAHESRVQRNCSFQMLDLVARGHMYLYRVLRPERATIAIASRNGSWVIQDLRAKCNEPVAPLTEQLVETWLAEHSESADTAPAPQTAAAHSVDWRLA